MILYNLTERKTFENINDWIQKINNSSQIDRSKNAIFVIVKKIDLVESGKSEKVTEEEVMEICKENKME